MSFDLVLAVRNERIQVIADRIDDAATPGKLWLYAGTKPGTAGGTHSSALQCSITLAQPCGVVESAILTFEEDTEGVRIDTQDITWGRFVDGDDNVVADVNVTAVGGGGTIQISSVSGPLGGVVRLETGVVAE